MTEEQSSAALAAWLEDPSKDPPAGLDPSVLSAVLILRPDLAPPPRVRLEEILERPAPKLSAPSSTGDVVPLLRRTLLLVGGLSGVGVLAAAAATLLVVALPLVQAPPPDTLATPASAPVPVAPIEAPETAQAKGDDAAPAPTANEMARAETPQKAKDLAPPPPPAPARQVEEAEGIADLDTTIRDAGGAGEYRTGAADGYGAGPLGGSVGGLGAGAAPAPPQASVTDERAKTVASTGPDLDAMRAAAVPTDVGATVTAGVEAASKRAERSDAPASTAAVAPQGSPALAASEAEARARLAAGDLDGALAVVNQALARERDNTPWHSALLVTRGDIHRARGDLGKAMADWEEAARLNAKRASR